MKRSTFLCGSLAAIFTMAIAVVSPAWAQAPFDPPGLDRAIAAQEFHTDRLFLTDGVVGTGVGVNARGQAAIVVMTEDLWVTGLPRSLDGVPVVVRVTGTFRAINRPDANGNHDHDDTVDDDTSTEIDPTSKFDRPVPIGVSTGNATSCSAGTIGARVIDLISGDVYALSNNHVYALENNATLGDVINQPGRFDRNDGTTCLLVATDQIGTLFNYVEIDFSTNAFNTVDAAIALSSTGVLGNSTPSDGYGTPSSITAHPIDCLNKRVQKYGRTTSLTKGLVFAINATVNIGYGSGTARFVDQILVDGGGKGGFILPGDSGSLLVLQKNEVPCGLLFAGTSTGRYGIANRIDDVLSAFGVEIDGY